MTGSDLKPIQKALKNKIKVIFDKFNTNECDKIRQVKQTVKETEQVLLSSLEKIVGRGE